MLFINSSIDEHLSCFHLLAMVNNVTVNIVVQLSLQDLTLILLDIYPEMELLDQVVIFFFSFGGATTLFSIADALFYIPTSSVYLYSGDV